MDDPRDDRRHLGLKLLSGLNPFVMADSFVSFDDLKDDSMQVWFHINRGRYSVNLILC